MHEVCIALCYAVLYRKFYFVSISSTSICWTVFLTLEFFSDLFQASSIHVNTRKDFHILLMHYVCASREVLETQNNSTPTFTHI